MTGSTEPSQHPFFSHLITLLSLYESPPQSPPPAYNGPTDWLIEAIERGIHALGNRAIQAEHSLQSAVRNSAAFRNSHFLVQSGATGALDDHPSKRLRRDHSGTPDSVYISNYHANEDGIIPGTGVLDRLSPMDSEDVNPLGGSHPHGGPLGSSHGSGDDMDEDTLDGAADGTNGSMRYGHMIPHSSFMMCPTCGRPNILLNGYRAFDDQGMPISAESGMSAVEELKLLKAQVQDVARVCRAVAAGDLSQKVTVAVQGVVMVQLKDVINTMVERLGQFAQEVTRVSLEVGTQGKLGGQAVVADVEGTWQELTATVNKLAENLTIQVRSIAEVTMAVARGDLSREIVVEAQGEILELKTTVNNMVRIFLRTVYRSISHRSRTGGSITAIRIGSHTSLIRSRHGG